jgi:MFS family permease
MVVSTVFENISNDSIFFKLLNKETRGMLTGVYSIVAQIGTLLFSWCAGGLFDSMGPKSPFILIGIIDFSMVIIFVTAVCFGVETSPDQIHA